MPQTPQYTSLIAAYIVEFINAKYLFDVLIDGLIAITTRDKQLSVFSCNWCHELSSTVFEPGPK
jgi:hypothetical protein